MPFKPTVTNPPIPGHDEFAFSPLQQVRVLYVSFVKGLFASAPVGSYHWAPGEESEIYISDESPIQSDISGQRPAINFTRGPVKFYSLGIDDMLSYSFETGQKRKSVLVPGVMSINCCSRSDLESERLAFIVAEHLWLLRERLMKQGFFEIGRQPQISATSPAGSIVAGESGQEWFCTSVQSPFQFPRTSQITPLNQEVIQNIEVQLRAETRKVMSKGWPASPYGHELPVDVHMCPPESFSPDATDTWGRSPDPGAAPSAGAPKTYHPLNPTVEVRVRSVNPYKPGLKSLSTSGQVIPLEDPCVKESGVNHVVSRVKI